MISPGSKLREDESEALSDLEVAALQRRLAPDGVDFVLGDSGAVTLRDVAEASGLGEGDVAAHLRQIRAESAFAAPKTEGPSALPWIAAGALVVGLGVTWWRLHLPVEVPAPVPASEPMVIQPTADVRPFPKITSLEYHSFDNSSHRAPSGFHVEVVGQTSTQRNDTNEAEARALPYEEVRDGLERTVEELADMAYNLEGGKKAPPGAVYMVGAGWTFSPRPGFVRAIVSGWTGSEAGWIAVPISAASRESIRNLAVKVLESAKRTQDEALRPVADPSVGMVSPPPAFAVRFSGRRLDVQTGPPISFAAVSPTLVAAKLKAAVLNAIARDRRPPVGHWTGNAAQDAKIPQPAVSHVEIMGPETMDAGDIPTSPDDPAATLRAVDEIAKRAARQIEWVNRKALGTDGNAHP